MQLHRQEDISLHLYIKDTVLAPQYSEIATGMTFSQAVEIQNGSQVIIPNTWNMSYDNSQYGKEPFRRLEYDIDGLGRGLLYFDTYSDGLPKIGVEQVDKIIVYSGGNVVSGYEVNYLNGQIVTTDNASSYTVDYEWHWVSVIDAWPWDEVPQLPIVTIQRGDADSRGYQLGGGAIREGDWTIEIFANNRGERDDMMDIIYDKIYMHRCPIYSFANGLPIGYDGLYNKNFTTDLVTNQTSMYFDNPKKKLTGLPKWGFYEHELINRYRAQIVVTTRNYSN